MRFRMLRITALAVVSICCYLPLVSCGTRPQQKTVVLYCSVDQEIAAPIIAAFEKGTGIRVLVRYDTEASKTLGLVQKIRAESARPVADVFWSSEVFHTVRLAQDSLLQPHSSPTAKDRPAHFADPGGLWYAFAIRFRTMAWNTRRVTDAEAPRTLEDVLDPKWKGRIVMARPQFGTTSGDVASWFVHYGPQRATEILKALKANDVRFVDGNSNAIRDVASGKADICFTDCDDVYASQRNGMPVAMTPLDQDGRGALAIPNTVAAIKGAPHPTEAAILIDFLLGPDVDMMLLKSDAHTWPVRPVAEPQFRQYALEHPLDINYEEVAENMDLAVKTAGEVLY
jgi:iron(III) transport system substrate-binding protein